jgi:hypothetical protein
VRNRLYLFGPRRHLVGTVLDPQGMRVSAAVWVDDPEAVALVEAFLAGRGVEERLRRDEWEALLQRLGPHRSVSGWGQVQLHAARDPELRRALRLTRRLFRGGVARPAAGSLERKKDA